MVEQSHAGEAHRHAVSVGSLDDIVIADASARFRNILDSALSCALDIVTEWEESVGTDRDSALSGDPRRFLLRSEDFGLDLENRLPGTLAQDIVMLIGNIYVDSVVSVWAADAVYKLKAEYFRMLAEIPGVSLGSCKTCAMDPALLACAYADRLSVLYVAY